MRRRTMIGLVLLVAVASTLVLVLRPKEVEAEGYVSSFQALEDGGAVGVWHAGGARDLTLVRFAADGRVAWKRATGLRGVHTSIVAKNGVVVVRTWTSQNPETDTDSITALAIDDGRQLWSQPADPKRGWRGRPSSFALEPSVVADGYYLDSVTEGSVERSVSSLFALDIASGKLMWKRALPTNRRRIAIGGRVLFENSFEASSFEAKTGTLTTAAVNGSGCVLGEVYYNITGKNPSHTLTAFPGGNLKEPRAIGQLSFATEHRQLGRIENCGSYLDELVFLISTRSMFAQDLPSAFLVIVGLDGQVRQLQEVGADAKGAFSGELQRYLLFQQGSPEAARHSIFDLQDRKIVWQGQADARVASRRVLRVADRWILAWEQRQHLVIAELDGRTGAVRAVALKNFVLPIDGLEAAHVTAKGIWLFGDRSATALDEVQRVVLDPSSLEPRFSRGVDIVDATQDAKVLLGM
jgi:hypothetical protein